MHCLICNVVLEKKKNKFCSIKCKSESQKGKRPTLDRSKRITCKIDGAIFVDYENRSGILGKHSKNILQKEFDWNDWEVINAPIEIKEIWKCPMCEWTSIDITNKSGWITTHLKLNHDLTPNDFCEKYPEQRILWQQYWKSIKRHDFIYESEENRIQCLECFQFFKSITNTHLAVHGMNEFQYKQKYGIDYFVSDYMRKNMIENYKLNENFKNPTYQSRYEIELIEFFNEHDIVVHDRSYIFGFEVDLYIPDLKLAIEFNGLHYHSEYTGGKLKYYHRNKTELCEAKGIRLIHIFEDDWNDKKDIIKCRLLNLMRKLTKKIYARKCKVKQIDYDTLSNFLTENHLQGSIDTGKIRLGLYSDLELVSVMNFSPLRISLGNKKSDEGCYELLRFCNKKDMNVIGSANKLLSYFELVFNPKSITTFADRCWSSLLCSTIYEKMKFLYVGKTEPNYQYIVNGKRKHRFGFTKSKILSAFKNADPNIGEWENMINLGYDRIWDCGSLKFQKKYDVKSPAVIEILDEPEVHQFQRVKSKRKIKQERKRNISNVICKICQNEYTIVGMYTHLKLQHKLTVQEYVDLHGEYRPKQLRDIMLNESIADKFKCLICAEEFATHQRFAHHVRMIHKPFVDYVKCNIFKGEIQYCNCGCNTAVSLSVRPPYRLQYISGHNPNGMKGKKQKLESVEKQKRAAIGRYSLKWFQERYGAYIGAEKYKMRGKYLSESKIKKK